VNFPFICNNNPAAPAYWVYISQLIRYFIAWLSWIHHFECFMVATMTCFSGGCVARSLVFCVVLFILAMVFSILPLFMDSDYPFGIFKLFL
jgi:hypothetical protein